MERMDVICPSCKKVRVILTKDEDDLRVYINTYCHKMCPECKDSPEAKLLGAVFGEAPVNCNENCPFYSVCTLK